MIDAAGPKLDQGALVRLLSEMIFFPAALLSEDISWEAVDDSAARATLRVGELEVWGLFRFDDEGDVVDFYTDERYFGAEEGAEMRPWVTPVEAYGERGGLRVPVRGQAVWKLEGGDYSYVKLEVTEVEYDALLPYRG